MQFPPIRKSSWGRPFLTHLLHNLNEAFDVILIDTPASTEFADAHMLAAKAGAAMVVAHKNFSQLELVRQQTESMIRSGIEVVGSVLSEF